jgi:hypothetical protein
MDRSKSLLMLAEEERESVGGGYKYVNAGEWPPTISHGADMLDDLFGEPGGVAGPD